MLAQSSRFRLSFFSGLMLLATTADAQRVATMAGRSPVYAPNGVAATSQPLATTAAIEVLEHGGNAIDAAVTAAAVLAVVEPMMTASAATCSRSSGAPRKRSSSR